AQLVDTGIESYPEEAPSKAEESGDELGDEDIEEKVEDESQGLRYGATRRSALESTEEIAPSTYDVGQSSRSVLEHEEAERVFSFRQTTFISWVDPEDGRVYTNIPTYVPLAAPIQTPLSPRWSLGSLPVSPSSSVVPSPIASPVATPAATISVDEDQFIKVGVQLELHKSILHDHTQRLDALLRTLFEGYDRDLRELYTRSGGVRDEIFSQRENNDLRRQLAEERRERLEQTDRVAMMEKRQEFGGE
ncbi:hypothetical protein Tco_1082465, partial [Tanacetum coccineum]